MRVDDKPVVLEEFRIPPSFDPATVRVFSTNTFHIDANALLEPPLDWTYFTVEKKVEDKKVIQFERLLGELHALLMVPAAELATGAGGIAEGVDPARLPEGPVPKFRPGGILLAYAGGEAPSYVCWARNNRSALIRVPLYKPNKGSSARFELRSIDSAANPYLAYALIINAGLAGIEGEYELPEEAEDDVWSLTERERQALGIRPLPRNLDEAIRAMENSELAIDTLGDHVHEFFLRNKRAEFDDYRAQVTPMELSRYLPLL